MSKSKKTTSETILNQDMTLISATNKEGVITFANDNFCKVSGYTADELIGKEHHIVRHPDMPKVVFKDLWEHLQSNKPWRGAVKNTSKDGGFYWVDAYITPIFENDKLVGYQSVRTKLGDEEKNKAIKLYAKLLIKEENKTSIFKLPQLSHSQKISTFIVFNLLFLVLAIMVNPLYSIVIPFLPVLIFFSEMVKLPPYYASITNDYDSISKEVFCDNKNNILEYYLKMSGGRVNTITGRVIDSCNSLLCNVEDLNSYSLTADKNIKHEVALVERANEAMEGLMESIAEIAESSFETLDKTNGAKETSDDVASKLDQTHHNIQNLTDDIEKSAQITQDLTDESNKISNVMDEINGIAEQTNLLALNAAIEAARAGEQGRGFAVVADEVRSLSQRTQAATVHIKSSISSIQETLKVLVLTMEEEQDTAKNCINITSETKNVLTSLCDSILEITDNVTAISELTEQQSMSTGSVCVDIAEIEESSGDNLSQIKQIAEGSQAIKDECKKLISVSKSF